MKKIVLLLVFLFMTNAAHAAGKILINEFLIDPTPQTVELFNGGNEMLDVSGWYIDDSGGSTFYTIPQGSILSPNECLVFSGDFSLNKTTPDTIRLFNDVAPPTTTSAQLMDSFSYKASSGSGVAYFRLPDGGSLWATGAATFGKSNTSGLSCLPAPTETPTPTPTGTPPPNETPTPALNSYDNIYISEVMVNPEVGEKEWVELYNGNTTAVTLSGWYIDDVADSGGSPKLFSTTIPAQGYAVVDLTSSLFNNDGDSVRLLDSTKAEKDSFEYSQSTRGQSLGRVSFDSDDVCLEDPSKGTANSSCLNGLVLASTSTGNKTASATPIKPPKVAASALKSSHSPTSQTVGTVPPNVGSVLAAATKQPTAPSRKLPRAFSFISFSYSLLTVLSVLARMKLHA